MDSLEKIRKRLGWTQVEIANAIGVVVTTYSRWKNKHYYGISPLTEDAIKIFLKTHGVLR